VDTPEERARKYRLRAEETRTAAEESHSPETRATFLRIASDYEDMADHLEFTRKRRRSVDSP
jgi:hypothetical protein